MNTEQLQIIVNAIQQLGEDGKVAFIWWLVLDNLPGVLGWMCTLVTIYFIVRHIVLAQAASNEIAEVCRRLDMESTAYLSYEGRNLLMKTISKHKAHYEQKSVSR